MAGMKLKFTFLLQSPRGLGITLLMKVNNGPHTLAQVSILYQKLSKYFDKLP